MNDLDILDEPVVQPAFEIWGQAFVAVWKAALVKGEGKVPFDPKVHKNMVYAIDLSILPIDEQDARTAERKLIQTSIEWELTQRSIKDLGIAPSEIDQKFVKIAFEQTGETYTNSNGEVKNKTFIKFLKVFKDVDECRRSFGEGYFGDTGGNAVSDESPASDQQGADAARKLLEASIRSAAKAVSTPEEVKALVLVKIKASPVMARFFDENSPELDTLIMAEMK